MAAAVHKRIPFSLWSTLHCEAKWDKKWSVSRPYLKEQAFENALYVDLSAYKDDNEKVEAAIYFMETSGACRGDRINRNMIELGFEDADKQSAAIKRGFNYKNKKAAFGRVFPGADMWIVTVSGVNGTVEEMTRALKEAFTSHGDVVDICLRTMTKANLVGRAADVYVRKSAVVEDELPSLMKIGDKYANVSWRKFIMTCGYCRQTTHTTSECEALARKGGRRANKRRRKSQVLKTSVQSATTAPAKKSEKSASVKVDPTGTSTVDSRWAPKGDQTAVESGTVKAKKAKPKKTAARKAAKQAAKQAAGQSAEKPLAVDVMDEVPDAEAQTEAVDEAAAGKAAAINEDVKMSAVETETKSAELAAADEAAADDDLEMVHAEVEVVLANKPAAAEEAAAAKEDTTSAGEESSDMAEVTMTADEEDFALCVAETEAVAKTAESVATAQDPLSDLSCDVALAGQRMAPRSSRLAKIKAKQNITQMCTRDLGVKRMHKLRQKQRNQKLN